MSENWFLCKMGTSLTLISPPVVRPPLEPSAWSCITASSSTCSVSWAGCCAGGLAQRNQLVWPPRTWESSSVSACSWAELCPPTVFPLQLCPWALRWNLCLLPTLSRVSGSPYPPAESPLAASHWPEGSKTKPGCPTPIAEQLLHIALESSFSKAHQSSALLPSHGCILLTAHCLKCEQNLGFIFLVTWLSISSISGTISVMNCRWSY